MKKVSVAIAVCLLLEGCALQPMSEYLTVRARINDKPVQLVVDTGAFNLTCSRQMAEKLNLKVSNPAEVLPVEPGRVPVGFSEKCRLLCPEMDFDGDVIWAVFDCPPPIALIQPFDGIIGWSNIKCNILSIDAEKKTVTALEDLPAALEGWSKWPIYQQPDDDTLLIKVPDATGRDGIVLIDTGDPKGVSLNERQWNDWKVSNEGQPHSLSASYTPAVGLKVYEEYWAASLSIGDFTLSNVPVRPSDAVWEQAYPNYQATLGLFALSRLDVIVDGPGGTVYTRPKKNPQSVYRYNRAGATFLPENMEGDQFIGHVVDNGPAFQAGMRNGDRLLKVNGKTVQMQGGFGGVGSFERPAGTKVQLLLLRDDKPLSVTVELANIFPQDCTNPKHDKGYAPLPGHVLHTKPVTLCEDSNILEKINQYRQAAERGDAEAQYNLGDIYAKGWGLPQDYTEAAKWFLESAKQNHAMAQHSMGVLYYNGQGVDQNYTEAAAWLRKAAEQGDATAQYSLGTMYVTGEGVEKNYTEAAKWFLKSAQQGNAIAQNDLGFLYLNGTGIEQNYTEAAKWFLLAAQQENAMGQNNLGVMYLEGKGVAQDYTEAATWFLKSAEQGYPPAQNNLGAVYRDGQGVEQDYAEATKWFLKAAEQGYPPAQHNLGVVYRDGQGVEQDYAEATKWFLKAAEQEYPPSQHNLAHMYQNGYGVERDYVEAIKWYRQAAEQGFAPAQNDLGSTYQNGYGVEQDNVEAIKWYRQAAEQGFAMAQNNLGMMYAAGKGIAQDYTEAATWFLKSAEQGYPPAQNNLGVVYRDGQGVEQDYAEATKWFRQGAEQGHPLSQHNLGFMYQNGYGVERDYVEAIKWYRQAAEQGFAVAQNNLGVMYQNGYGVEQDNVEAIKWYRQAAEQGFAVAQNNLAFMYANGYGVDKDLVEAYKWILVAGVNGFYNTEGINFLEANMTGKQKDEGRRLANEYVHRDTPENQHRPNKGTTP